MLTSDIVSFEQLGQAFLYVLFKSAYKSTRMTNLTTLNYTYHRIYAETEGE